MKAPKEAYNINNMKSLLLLLLLATVATQASESEAYVYKALTCSEENYQGVCHEFHEAVPSMSSYDFDNSISSYKLTGVWLFYEDPDYKTPRILAWGLNTKTNYIGIIVDDKVSSLRYAGNQTKFNEAGYNLYEDIMFEQKDFYGSIDIPDLSQYIERVRSAIIIGQSSWKFCEGANYSGNCVCLKANQYDWNLLKRLDVGIYSFLPSQGLHNVTSIKKGCT